MKNAFDFILKALFVLKRKPENILIKKITLVSKFMTHQPDNKQLKYIYLYISRSKGNQTKKFDQLIHIAEKY